MEIAQWNASAPQTQNPSLAASVSDIGQQLRSLLKEQGFVILRGHIPKEHCCKAREVMDRHIANTLLSMGFPEASKHGPAGLLKVKHTAWHKTPPGWDGKKFGIKKSLGYNRCLGGGQLFTSKSFRAEKDLVHVQECVRDVNEQLHTVQYIKPVASAWRKAQD